MEKVEEVYKKNPLVEQIFVYGNSMESTLVAVLVPVGKTAEQLPCPRNSMQSGILCYPAPHTQPRRPAQSAS